MHDVKVIATGGRDYRFKDYVFAALDYVNERLHISYLMDGGATGADALAKQWRTQRGIDGVSVEADWDRECDEKCYHSPRYREDGKRYCPRAGLLRNQKMIDLLLPDLVIAFPGANGTADMVARATMNKIYVVQFTGRPVETVRLPRLPRPIDTLPGL